jgi:hypothetical protein
MPPRRQWLGTPHHSGSPKRRNLWCDDFRVDSIACQLKRNTGRVIRATHLTAAKRACAPATAHVKTRHPNIPITEQIENYPARRRTATQRGRSSPARRGLWSSVPPRRITVDKIADQHRCCIFATNDVIESVTVLHYVDGRFLPGLAPWRMHGAIFSAKLTALVRDRRSTLLITARISKMHAIVSRLQRMA